MILHEAIVDVVFGQAMSNDDVSWLLFKIGLAYTGAVFILSIFFPASYGRYRERASSTLPCKVND